jgi:beta-galactosidase
MQAELESTPMKKLTYILLPFLLLNAFPIHVQAQDSRRVIDFINNWLFEQDDWIGFYHGSWMNWNESTWIPVRTPHTYNAEDTFDKERGYYRGMAWYRKHFRIPESEKGRVLKIHFGAIGNESEIWVNEQFLGKFTTGYTPIEVDISEVVSYEDDNVIAIRVNNLHNDEKPPGRWRMDYNVYGGIYREINLLSLSPIYLEENTFYVTTPKVEEGLSKVSVSASVRNTTNEEKTATLQCILLDGSEERANFSRDITLPPNQLVPAKDITASIKDIELWSPGNPKLYTLKVILVNEATKIDVLETKIGFRTFSFDAEKGFVLNENSMKLHGINRHQCYPGLGNAVPKRLQIEDAVLL